MPTSLRLTAKDLTFNDTQSDRLNGQIDEKLQAYLEQIDRAQDLDDTSNFRRENVLSELPVLTTSTPDGSYLFTGAGTNTNKLVFVESGAIVKSYTPKTDDAIVIDGIIKFFNGSIWIDFKGGSEYWLDPVKIMVDVLPDISTVNEGDRFLLSGNPPSIKVFENGSFVSQDFPDFATVKASYGVTYQRRGRELIALVAKYTKDRVPTLCDNNYPLGSNWEYNNQIWKAIAFETLGTQTEIINGGGRSDLKDVKDSAGTNQGETWQTFTPSVEGGISNFSLQGFYSRPVPVIFRLYLGSGIDGELLYETKASFPAGSSQPLPLNCNYGVESGKRYTWSVTENWAVRVSGLRIWLGTDRLSGERADIDPERDYDFSIAIAPTEGIIWKNLAETEFEKAKIALAKYGEDFTRDDALNLILSRQIRAEGGGQRDVVGSGYIKRFAEGDQLPDEGMSTNKGMLIIGAKITCKEVATGRTLEFRHYDLDGNDEQIAGVVAINIEQGRLGFAENVRFYIPGRRRLAPLLIGNYERVQVIYDYREVLEIL